MADSQQRPEASPRGKPGAGSTLRVVAIGGGTGLSTLLKGLKEYVAPPVERVSVEPGQPLISELCAVVTVSDDGGSSGRLRKELNMLPPGDIRNCIVALSEDEALLSRLFQHRFVKGSGLEGRGSDLDHQRLRRGGTALVGNFAHPRPHLSGDNLQRRTGGPDGGRDTGAGRDQDHREQGPN